ncbi:MAG: HDOD domain-containing protein [Fimbriimonadaceae bacterium]|nr:HDOD domain-containing protein [Fimbriimonadaceae bacterium]QYK55485.1 MAG: HDOD domain-containing protein [Fimbriimonadaceae bacterium]
MAEAMWMSKSWQGDEFDRLAESFRTAESLPDMPSSALNLCEAIDGGSAGAGELERIILGDPAITAGVLRAANSALYGGGSRQTSTVKGAIMMLGQKAVRSVAVSVWVQSFIHKAKGSPRFSPKKFAEYSMFVGFLAKFLLSVATKTNGARSSWSPDELFAAGVLNKLGLGLLASIVPGLYDAAYDRAKASNTDLSEGFNLVTGRYISELSVAAAMGWKLPDLFIEALRGADDPLAAEKEQAALCCLRYADYLTCTNGFSLVDWPVEATIDEKIIQTVGLPETEVAQVLELVDRHTKEYIKAA